MTSGASKGGGSFSQGGGSGGTGVGGGGGGGGGSHADPMDQYIQLLSPVPGSSPPTASTVRAVLHQALTNPRVYGGFAEVRSLPAVVEALDGTEGGEATLRTLELFAYGAYGDYTSAEGSGKYLPLTEGQIRKLRQLTVVGLVQKIADSSRGIPYRRARRGAGRNPKHGEKGRKPPSSGMATCVVPYSAIRSELSLPPDSSVRYLEDLLISCIYSGLFSGRLDQRSMSLLIGPGSAHQPPCAARDVDPSGDGVGRMIEALESFRRRGEEVALALERAATEARDGRTRDAERWAAAEDKAKGVRSRIRERMGAGSGGGHGPEGVVSLGGALDAWDSMEGMGATAAMDLSMEGGGVPGSRRQSKRIRGGAYGGEPYGRY